MKYSVKRLYAILPDSVFGLYFKNGTVIFSETWYVTIFDNTPSPLQVSANFMEWLSYYDLKCSLKSLCHFFRMPFLGCKSKTAQLFFLKLSMWLFLKVLYHFCKFKQILCSGFFTIALTTMKYSTKSVPFFDKKRILCNARK